MGAQRRVQRRIRQVRPHPPGVEDGPAAGGGGVAVGAPRQHRAPVGRDQFHIHAEPAQQVLRDQRLRVVGRDVGRADDDHGLVGVAGLAQHLPRAVEVAADRPDPLLRGERRAAGEEGLAFAEVARIAHHRLQVVGLVHRHLHRAADRRVVEGRMQVVEAQHQDRADRVDLLDPHVPRALEQRQQVEGGLLVPVHLPGLQRGGGGRGVGDDPPLDAVHMHPLAPGGRGGGFVARHVAGELLVHGLAARHPLVAHEAERARADRLGHRGVRIEARVPFMHDEGHLGGQLPDRVDQQREGPGQADAEGAVVHHRHLGHRGHQGLAEGIARAPAAERGDHVLRAHRFVVVEAQAFAQAEGPDQVGAGPFPGFDHLGADAEIGIGREQRVVDHVAMVAHDVARGAHRVDRGQVGMRDEAQHVAGGTLGQGGGGQPLGGQAGGAGGQDGTTGDHGSGSLRFTVAWALHAAVRAARQGPRAQGPLTGGGMTA